MRGWLVMGMLLLAGCPRSMYYADGAGLEGQLDREIQALKAQIRQLEHQVATCHEEREPDRIFSDLNQIYAGTEVTVERDAYVTIVTIPGDHLFRFDSSDIREEAHMTLDLLATAMNLHPEYTAVIEGHTDDSLPSGRLGTIYQDNWDLSIGLAAAVVRKMSRTYGVSESRFTLVGRGEYDPISTNDTSSGRARNRRVVVYLRPPRLVR